MHGYPSGMRRGKCPGEGARPRRFRAGKRGQSGGTVLFVPIVPSAAEPAPTRPEGKGLRIVAGGQGASLRDSSLTFARVGEGIHFLPLHPMKFRVRLTIWQIDAADKIEAKKNVCDMLKSMPQNFVIIEEVLPRRGFLSSLLFGP